MSKTYSERQAELVQEAIDWQIYASENTMYMSELAEWGDYFHKLGKRYGLLTEFRENGIPC